jgi:extradiol dioxygenase family protein
MSEEGKWQDVDFWGNELTLHQSKPRNSDSLERHRHSVDMGDVIVPHLGIHLPLDEYQRVKASVASSVGFVDKPYIRFEDTDYQQETFFVEDPNFNVLEIKSMVKPKDY